MSQALTVYLFHLGDIGAAVAGDRDLIITLEEARLTSYSLSASSAQPAESYSIAYTSIAIAHYNEEDNGEIKKGDTIKFDLATAKLVSAAKLP